MTWKELYERGAGVLEDAGVLSPEVDAFYLLEHISGIDRGSYLLKKNESAGADCTARYEEAIRRRAGGEPYQYITGVADFMGCPIRVTPDVLIPRLDTEVLGEEAVRTLPEGARVLDLCTGSGCLAVALAALRPDLQIAAGDISGAALEVAAENAAANGVAEKIDFRQGDLFEAFSEDMFDAIVSNPPYVTEEEYRTLTPEVREQEPPLALLAGPEGLDIYRRLVPEAARHLTAGGSLLLEIGYLQGEAVRGLMEEAGFAGVKIIKDLAGLDRVVTGRREE